jgi:hypothetical protein
MKKIIHSLIFGVPKDFTPEPVKTLDVTRITESMDKVENMLTKLREENGNPEAITTWLRVKKNLLIEWQDALVEIQTNGKYQYL